MEDKINHYRKEIFKKLDRYSTVNRGIEGGRRMMAGLCVQYRDYIPSNSVKRVFYNDIYWTTGEGSVEFIMKRLKCIRLREETPKATQEMFHKLCYLINEYKTDNNIPDGKRGDIRYNEPQP